MQDVGQSTLAVWHVHWRKCRRRHPANAPSLVIDRSWKALRMSGRLPRYALTCRYGRPGKPTSQSEVGQSPAKRDLDAIFTLLSDALNVWLAFKRATFNVCVFCMAARTVAGLSMSGAFFSSKVLLSYEVMQVRAGLISLQNTQLPARKPGKRYWLRLLAASEDMPVENLQDLTDEADQIVAIWTTIAKKCRAGKEKRGFESEGIDSTLRASPFTLLRRVRSPNSSIT